MAEKKKSPDQKAKEAIMNLYHTLGKEPWLIAKLASSGFGFLYGAFHSDGVSIYKFDKIQPILTQTHAWKSFTTASVDFFALKTVIVFSGEENTNTLAMMEKGKALVSLLRSNTDITIIVIDRPWWNMVPGFRTQTKWKMVVAVIAYLALFGGIVDAANNDQSTKATTSTAPAVTASAQTKTPEQIAQDKVTVAKISASDKELLKKSYSTFDAQQINQFAEIEKKYKILPNAEVADISADFARLSTEKIAVEKKQAEEKAAAEAKVAYQDWVQGQFSAWDGSNIYLVNLLKEHLNDPKSFDHVDTTYSDHGDYLIIKMTYRAKNGFGGLVLQNVTAKSDYKTKVISIISQNN